MVFEGGAKSSQSKCRFVAQHEINDNCIYGTRDLSNFVKLTKILFGMRTTLPRFYLCIASIILEMVAWAHHTHSFTSSYVSQTHSKESGGDDVDNDYIFWFR